MKKKKKVTEIVLIEPEGREQEMFLQSLDGENKVTIGQLYWYEVKLWSLVYGTWL